MKFCQERFYNLDALKSHIKTHHHQCDICRQDQPYMVYKDYDMLRKHFESSHFLCEEPECIEMKVIVFGSSKELDYHRDKVHRANGGKKKFNAGNLLGVRINDEEDDYDDYLLQNSNQSARGGRGGRGGASNQEIGRAHV